MITRPRTIAWSVSGVLALTSAFFWTASAQSAPTTILFVSGSGAVGGIDPVTEYSIDGITWSGAAIVPPCCQLGQSAVNYDLIPGTQLIARDSTAQTPGTPVTLYRVFFTLPQQFGLPLLQIKMNADNVGQVFLNGTLVGSQPGGSSPPVSNFKNPPSLFTAFSGFVGGINELRFRVVNTGGPSILNYTAQITYYPPIPPPGANICANPTIIGTPGNDSIVAIGPRQVIDGMGGDDAIVTGDFDDIICGGDGNDTISSGGGSDFVFGGNGNDVLAGGDDFDVLFGDAGNDTVAGGGAFDACVGGPGTNILSGCP